MTFLFLAFLFFTALIYLPVFIDRFILSKKGFKSFLEFVRISIVLLFSLIPFLAKLIMTFPFLTKRSLLLVLFLYHLTAFFMINFIIITLVYFVFYLDYLLNTYLKEFKFHIFTCNYISHKNLLNNKSFLILSLGISYILSTLIILFPLPDLILSMIDHTKNSIDLANSQIETYQKFFVFSSVPIVFSLMKNK